VNSNTLTTDKHLVVAEVVEIVPKVNAAEVVVVIVHKVRIVKMAKFNVEEEAAVNAEVALMARVVAAEVVADVPKEPKVKEADPKVNAAEEVVAVEADLEQLLSTVRKVPKSSVLNVAVKEVDTKANLARKTIHSIVKMALAVADAVIRKVVTEKATGANQFPSPTKP
jgi:hypothetical protein